MAFNLEGTGLTEARLILAVGILGLLFYVVNDWKPWLFYLAILWGFFRILDNWENWLKSE